MRAMLGDKIMLDKQSFYSNRVKNTTFESCYIFVLAFKFPSDLRVQSLSFSDIKNISKL